MASSEKRIARWYFGGLASSGAALFTHPLDLIKVYIEIGHLMLIFSHLHTTPAVPCLLPSIQI